MDGSRKYRRLYWRKSLRKKLTNSDRNNTSLCISAQTQKTERPSNNWTSSIAHLTISWAHQTRKNLSSTHWTKNLLNSQNASTSQSSKSSNGPCFTLCLQSFHSHQKSTSIGFSTMKPLWRMSLCFWEKMTLPKKGTRTSRASVRKIKIPWSVVWLISKWTFMEV